MRRAPPRIRAALVALAVGASGCGGCPGRARTERAEVSGELAQPPAPGTGSPAPQRRVGVKVPLPTGWSARTAPDGSLQFGPATHAVLRVDLRANEGAALPEAETLRAALVPAFAGFVRSREQREEGPDYVGLRLWLALARADAGTGTDGGTDAGHPAFLGARRVERDLLLCASLPGVTEDEVREAAVACRAIHRTDSPLP